MDFCSGRTSDKACQHIDKRNIVTLLLFFLAVALQCAHKSETRLSLCLRLLFFLLLFGIFYSAVLCLSPLWCIDKNDTVASCTWAGFVAIESSLNSSSNLNSSFFHQQLESLLIRSLLQNPYSTGLSSRSYFSALTNYQ